MATVSPLDDVGLLMGHDEREVSVVTRFQVCDREARPRAPVLPQLTEMKPILAGTDMTNDNHIVPGMTPVCGKSVCVTKACDTVVDAEVMARNGRD